MVLNVTSFSMSCLVLYILPLHRRSVIMHQFFILLLWWMSHLQKSKISLKVRWKTRTGKVCLWNKLLLTTAYLTGTTAQLIILLLSSSFVLTSMCNKHFTEEYHHTHHIFLFLSLKLIFLIDLYLHQTQFYGYSCIHINLSLGGNVQLPDMWPTEEGPILTNKWHYPSCTT
jgi:hypothetical protein